MEDDNWNRFAQNPTVISNDVILISDDEEIEEKWSNRSLWYAFTRVCKKARELTFKRIKNIFLQTSNSTAQECDNMPEFSYQTFQEILEEFQRINSKLTDMENKTFLWQNIIKWLLAIRNAYDIIDLKNEGKWNFMLIETMAEYINFKSSLSTISMDKREIDLRISEILNTLGSVFYGKTNYILMTLLRVDMKTGDRLILDAIFRKYCLDRRNRHHTNDLVSYMRLVLCLKRWKRIIPSKAEREALNDLVVGSKKFPTESDLLANNNVPPILPKAVPPCNKENHTFSRLCDLIRFAIQQGESGTKVLLVYTTLDLEEVCSKYLRRFEQTLTKNRTESTPSTPAKRKKIDNAHIAAIAEPMPGLYFDSICETSIEDFLDNTDNLFLMENIDKQKTIGHDPNVEHMSSFFIESMNDNSVEYDRNRDTPVLDEPRIYDDLTESQEPMLPVPFCYKKLEAPQASSLPREIFASSSMDKSRENDCFIGTMQSSKSNAFDVNDRISSCVTFSEDTFVSTSDMKNESDSVFSPSAKYMQADSTS